MSQRVTAPPGDAASKNNNPHPPKRVKTHNPPEETGRKTQWQNDRTRRITEDFATDNEDEESSERIEDVGTNQHRYLDRSRTKETPVGSSSRHGNEPITPKSGSYGYDGSEVKYLWSDTHRRDKAPSRTQELDICVKECELLLRAVVATGRRQCDSPWAESHKGWMDLAIANTWAIARNRLAREGRIDLDNVDLLPGKYEARDLLNSIPEQRWYIMRITRSVVRGAYDIDQGVNTRSGVADALLTQECYECIEPLTAADRDYEKRFLHPAIPRTIAEAFFASESRSLGRARATANLFNPIPGALIAMISTFISHAIGELRSPGGTVKLEGAKLESFFRARKATWDEQSPARKEGLQTVLRRHVLNWANLSEEDVISDKMPSKNPYKDDVSDLAEFGILAAPREEPSDQGIEDDCEDMENLDHDQPYQPDRAAQDILDQQAQDDLDQDNLDEEAQRGPERGNQQLRPTPNSSFSSDLPSLHSGSTVVPGTDPTARPFATPDSGFLEHSQNATQQRTLNPADGHHLIEDWYDAFVGSSGNLNRLNLSMNFTAFKKRIGWTNPRIECKCEVRQPEGTVVWSMDISNNLEGYKAYISRVLKSDGDIWLFPSPQGHAGKVTSTGQTRGKVRATG